MCLHRLGLTATIFATLVALGGASEQAQAVTFKASFSPLRLNARPGQVLTTVYRVGLELGDPTTQLKISVQDWWRSEDGKQSFYSDGGSISRSCSSWTSINPHETSLAGGQTLEIRVTVSVPQGAKPGGYWCALTVDEVANPLAAQPVGVAVRFLASLSTGIYVSIDPIERGAEILSVDLRGDEAVARVRNTGNTPLQAEGRFEFLKPGEREPIATAPLARTTVLTEPVTTALLSAALPGTDRLPPGRYVVRFILDYGLDHYIGVQRELDLQRSSGASQRR